MDAAPRLPAGFRLVALDAVGSTNDEAKRLARAGAGHGTLVWAREQTAGRGRTGRTWSSPRGNLYVSLVLRPQVPPARVAELSFVGVVALGDAVAGLLPNVRPQYKWPNDLLIEGEKVAGLLLETESAGSEAVDWAVLGLGVNVASHPAGTPYPATSLEAVAGRPLALDPLLEALAGHFARWLERWRRDGFASVREAWKARARGIGGALTVRLPDRELSGRFIDLDPHGRLVLGHADGTTQLISAGDVFFGGASA